MRTIMNIIAAGAAGLFALGLSAASAEDRPDRCSQSHDHRVHDNNYYDYYQADRYSSAGRYQDASYRPDRCNERHDHRSHAANYYNFYPSDRYYRSGPYNRSGVSVSLSFGNNGYSQRGHNNRYSQRGHNNRYAQRGHNDHNYRRGNRVVNREVFQTRYQAKIILVEKISSRGHHGQKVCTVSVRGPDAHHVSHRRVRQIANNYCSRNARIRVYA